MSHTISEALTAEDAKTIGQLLIEILNGNVTTETVQNLSGDVPQPFKHLVLYAKGFQTSGEELARELQEELRGTAIELLEKGGEIGARGTGWIGVYNLLEHIFQGGDFDIRANVDMLPDNAPEWLAPVLEYIKSSSTSNKDAETHVLDMLEAMIQKRREQIK